MPDKELDQFKREINLSEYAAAAGYYVDRKLSTAGSVCMRHDGTDDKIYIKKAADTGFYIFVSARSGEGGTIVDFALNINRLANYGFVKKELRQWLSGGVERPLPSFYVSEIKPVKKDLLLVAQQYARCKPLLISSYLTNIRGIDPEILNSPRFKNKILLDPEDKYYNALFPHFNRENPKTAICFEIRSSGYKGTSKGGEKGLWFSVIRSDDTRLVICESAITALSHACLFPGEHSRYISTAGNLNDNQQILVKNCIQKMPEGSAIIIATDNDPGGVQLFHAFEELAGQTGREDLKIIHHTPPEQKQDWNDVLRKKKNIADPKTQLRKRAKPKRKKQPEPTLKIKVTEEN